MVKNGKVTDEIRWLSASEEEDYAVAQANAPLDDDGTFTEQLVLCRKGDDYPLLQPGADRASWTWRRSSWSPSPRR